PNPRRAMGTAPGQHTRSYTSPGNSGNEQPEKSVASGDGDKFALSIIGLQVTFKEAGPLHPTSISGNSDPDGKRQNDPAGLVWTRQTPGAISRDKPPGSPP